MAKQITPRSHDFSQWYLDLVKKANLAENSDVRGCMIIKPYGYGIWEKMQKQLDLMLKETGHVNAYFPLFVPKSYLAREASHVEGFAKECAIVTHYRLKNAADGTGIVVDPESKLEEELIVRPTSETVIWSSYKKWIQSYRDLPLLINQWANVVRWEMRTRLFLRTTEFLWQEGHTAHASEREAQEEAMRMLELYADFAEQYMAMPVVKGIKSENEKFPGAVRTYSIEALMQDGKALQAGTSHFLGQNFAKAFDVRYAKKDGTMDYVWGTSWGVSTRLIGGLIMAHSDDNGLILPPKLAPIHVVIVPIFNNEEELNAIAQRASLIRKHLNPLGYTVQFDDRDTYKPGFKFAEHELKGIPIRITIGSRDIEKNTMEIVRRDTKEKETLPFEKGLEKIPSLLESMQQTIYQKALHFREKNTVRVDDYNEFKCHLETQGGFCLAHWDGTPETEKAIKEDLKATIRCIPMNNDKETGKCIYSGKKSARRVLFAKAY